MWISNCVKICRHKLLNMDETDDFVIKSRKHGKYIFFLETEIVTANILNSKSLEKICHHLLSSMDVLIP